MFGVVFELFRRVLAYGSVVLCLCIFRKRTQFRKFFDIELRGSGMVNIIFGTIFNDLFNDLFQWFGKFVSHHHHNSPQTARPGLLTFLFGAELLRLLLAKS